MIVKDEKTLAQALALVAEKPVRYSDATRFALVTKPSDLSDYAAEAFERGDIAIVVPVGQEAYMESHDWELKMLHRHQREEEKRLVRKWVTSHPEAVAAAKKRLARRQED